MIEYTHTYDWFVIDDSTICLLTAHNVHGVIKHNNENYYLFQVMNLNKKGSLNYIAKSESINDLIDFVHSKILSHNSYAIIEAEWKFEPATAAQQQYAWGAETKWDATKHFAKYLIGKTFENYIHFDTESAENMPLKKRP